MRRLPFKSVDIPLTTSRFKKLNLETFKLPSEILERCMTPALILYKDSILRNVRTIIEKHCDSDPKKWRPHLKTTKSSALYNMLIQEGLTQFKVATTREAEIIAKSLRDSGISDGDVLIAYPLQGPNMRRLESIVSEFPEIDFSVLVESECGVHSISSSARLSCFVDINVGQNRTVSYSCHRDLCIIMINTQSLTQGIPLETAEKGAVVDVVNAIRDTGKKFRGLHLYDGHSQSFHDGEERDTKVGDVGEAGTRLMNILNQAGHSVEEIITAGTPSLTSALKFIESVHDDEDNVKRVVSPGTVVLHDLTSESSNAELDLEPACVVLARVVSHPCENIFTVDAGSKAMAAEAGHPMAYVFYTIFPTNDNNTQNVVITPLSQVLCRESRYASAHTVRGTPSDSGSTGNVITRAWHSDVFDSSTCMSDRKFVGACFAHGQ